eukprot:12051839-Heterocapsa_arctica.AAC.1
MRISSTRPARATGSHDRSHNPGGLRPLGRPRGGARCGFCGVFASLWPAMCWNLYGVLCPPYI